MRRLPRRRWGIALANLLAIVDADHHDEDLRLVRRNRLLDGLWPFDVVAALVETNEAGIGTMFPDYRKFGPFRKGIFQTIGQPIRNGVAKNHNRRGRARVRFFLWVWSTGEIDLYFAATLLLLLRLRTAEDSLERAILLGRARGLGAPG